MSVNLVDLFSLQLAQQAIIHNIAFLSDRKRSSERVAAFFTQLPGMLPITCTLEIGAHEATFSRSIKKKYPHITARAFEANPNVYDHFLFDAGLRTLGVEYKNFAVGETNGSHLFHIYTHVMGREESPDSRRQSCLLRVDSPEAPHYAINVPMIRLDTFCSGDNPQSRYALWIDAEGFGQQVLSGAAGILDRACAIYIELESIAKFAGQALDTDIMAFLMDLDFVPILRDFQFNHQYNVIFIKKEFLSLVEHELHRYFQAVLRRELTVAFELAPKVQQSFPVMPAPLPKLRLDNERELREAMVELPLLRKPACGLDSAKRSVVCHASDLAEAREFYRSQCRHLPLFYVLDPSPADTLQDGILDFTQLHAGMDIQLFFRKAARPDQTWYGILAQKLAHIGITAFHVEKSCMADFWRRNFSSQMNGENLETARHFFNLLHDAQSQYAYLAICHANATGDPGYLPLASYPQYAHPLVRAIHGDIVCEGGLEFFQQGNVINSTTLDFYEQIGHAGMIYGFEPVPDTYLRLKNIFNNNPQIILENMALWSHAATLGLSDMATPNRAHTHEGHGGNSCPGISIDDYFADKRAPTLIKLDVEGAEPQIITGSLKTLEKARPKLMTAIYHGRFGPDWITVPDIIMRGNFSYEYFCGHHTPWFAESFIYGKPMS